MTRRGLALWVLAAGCSMPGQDDLGLEDDPVAVCPELGLPQEVGALGTTLLEEASGITVGRSGTLWLHNDAGHPAELFGLAPDGEVRATVSLQGATNEDWEDIARFGNTLWVADIGDNDLVRDSVTLYGVQEPTTTGTSTAMASRSVEVTYPQGPRDAEALFIDPNDGSAYVVSKVEEDRAAVYRVPLDVDRTTAQLVGEYELPWPITGADMNDDGTALVLRTPGRALWWSLEPGDDLGDRLGTPGCEVPVGPEPDGEAIAMTDDGGYVTASEGRLTPLYRVRPRPQ